MDIDHKYDVIISEITPWYDEMFMGDSYWNMY